MDSLSEMASEVILDVFVAGIQNIVDEDGQAYHDKIDEANEEHLVGFSLLDALLPDVVLEASLLGTPRVTKVNNVLRESFVYALDVCCIHFEEAEEGLGHAESRGADGVLTLVNKVEYLYYHGVT